MTRFKDAYIDELERITSELEEAGIADAYALAGDRAYDAACDRLADAADASRQAQKDARI